MDFLTEQSPKNLIGKIVNTDQCEFLTPAHKLIYLKYIQLNTDFIYKPESYPKIVDQLCAELDKICGDISAPNWISIMKSWIRNIKNNYENMMNNRKRCNWTTEDFDLINLIDNNINIMQQPTKSQLSCILDHLEVAYSSPKVWKTISLEMEALGAPQYNGEHWQKAFEKWSNKVKRKKQILEEMGVYQSRKKSYLNTLENRLLEFLETFEISQTQKESRICRVCLVEKEQDIKYIHDKYLDSTTIADKICECAIIEEIHEDDGYPQYICDTCLKLLENAYKFKTLCEQSEYQLKKLDKSVDEDEYVVDYIIKPQETEVDSQNDKEGSSNISYDEDSIVAEDICIEPEICESNKDKSNDIKKERSEVSVHQCETCGIVCYNEVSLTKHMHSHSINRPHQCSVCKKDFKTKLSIKIHMRSHTGERPYVCEVCGKSFTQDATLTYHRAIHSGEKKYVCNICDHRARNINDLKIHMRKHTGARPYQCCHCPSKFTTSSNLQKHIRRHTGANKFQCGSCERSFFSRDSARKHMVIHTGLKPYTCAECPMAYGWYNGLQKHMKTQHPGLKMPTEKHFVDLMDK